MVIDIIRVATLRENNWNGGIEGAFVFAGGGLCLNCLELYRYSSLCLLCKTHGALQLRLVHLSYACLTKKFKRKYPLQGN